MLLDPAVKYLSFTIHTTRHNLLSFEVLPVKIKFCCFWWDFFFQLGPPLQQVCSCYSHYILPLHFWWPSSLLPPFTAACFCEIFWGFVTRFIQELSPCFAHYFDTKCVCTQLVTRVATWHHCCVLGNFCFAFPEQNKTRTRPHHKRGFQGWSQSTTKKNHGQHSCNTPQTIDPGQQTDRNSKTKAKQRGLLRASRFLAQPVELPSQHKMATTPCDLHKSFPSCTCRTMRQVYLVSLKLLHEVISELWYTW